jgi:diguanylate cyclase (GGDEF)-like protein/PAS domain S-box-containing protein
MITTPKRRTDAVLTIVQNNSEKTLLILEANDKAENLLGIPANELQTKDLRMLVAAPIKEAIDDFLEFEDFAPDLADVVSKLREFTCINQEGIKVPFECKIHRVSGDMGSAVFELILRDLTIRQSLEATRQTTGALKGYEIIDSSSGLPNYDSFMKDLEMVRFYMNRDQIYATLAVLEVDNYYEVQQQYGQEAADKLVYAIANRCKNNLRGEDCVGRISPSQLGILLVEANGSSAAIALNRLRWFVRSQPVEVGAEMVATPSISIGYAEISLRWSENELFKHCETAVLAAVQQGGNAIQAVAV